MGFPCCVRFPSCTCCRHYLGAATGRRLRSSHPAVSAFPEIAVGSACTSSFSRLARRSLGLRPAHSRRHLYVTRYTEGFSHFVTSMTAPVASGWSVRRVGLAPTGKRRLLTAHARSGCSARARRTASFDPLLTFKIGPVRAVNAGRLPWAEGNRGAITDRSGSKLRTRVCPAQPLLTELLAANSPPPGQRMSSCRGS